MKVLITTLFIGGFACAGSAFAEEKMKASTEKKAIRKGSKQDKENEKAEAKGEKSEAQGEKAEAQGEKREAQGEKSNAPDRNMASDFSGGRGGYDPIAVTPNAGAVKATQGSVNAVKAPNSDTTASVLNIKVNTSW